jgi:CubicO group peptidase (beta-lactamase class C family)
VRAAGRARRAGRALVAAAVALACLAGALWCPPAARAEDQSQAALVDSYMAGDAQGVGAAVLVAREGAVTVEQYYGEADPAGHAAVDADTAFEWGRCSDLLVWVAVMQLVERGELDLDEPVATYLPDGYELPDGYGHLDVVDLMNHTSGLDVSLVSARSSLPDQTRSAADALQLFSVEEGFSPGSIVGYTPLDAVLAAVVVEQVSGMPFVDYVQERIFDPLGMGDTVLWVGGSAARAGASGGSATLALGSDGPQSTSSPSPSTSTVFVCVGTASDLMKLALGTMGSSGGACVFEDAQTVDELFSVSRVYPSLGVARIAHGLFAFPFSSGVFGITATTSDGYSASVYLDPEGDGAYVALVNQSGRADLVQGVVRVLVGRTDTLTANAASPANAVWLGTYQDASLPNHGPAKIVTALERRVVAVSDAGVLMFDGLSATGLGAGVYSIDTAVDQDVYRFHVSLSRGNEFSRATSDFYAVPQSTLVLEYGLLSAAALGLLVCLAYTVSCAVRLVSARLRRRRFAWQPSVALLAALTVLAGAAAVYAAVQVAGDGTAAGLSFVLAGELAYVVAAAFMAVWLAVTRWRGSYAPRFVVSTCAVLLSALAVALNLAYWEMLP